VPGDAGRWGWHRLDSGWARRLVEVASVAPGDLVIDVGAGTGAITACLLDAGARVIAVELHPGRAAALRQRFVGRPVKVVRADASDLRLPGRPFKVVANPPFSVSSALVRRLTGPRSCLDRGALVLPWWAAMRWATGASTPGRGRAGTTRGGFVVDVTCRIPIGAFSPPPPASPAIVVVHRCR
jgi:23S rRNA (adenine-N6)-dimethyltransferase